MSDSLLPPMGGLNLVQELPSIVALATMSSIPDEVRAMRLPIAAHPAALVASRPFINLMADAREAGDGVAYDNARSDLLAGMSAATVIDLLENADAQMAADKLGLPKMRQALATRSSASVGALVALSLLTKMLSPNSTQ